MRLSSLIVKGGLVAQLAAAALAVAPSALAAADDETPSGQVSDDAQAELQAAAEDSEVLAPPGDAQLPSSGALTNTTMNRWVCFATSAFTHREYYGSSQWFPGGSGQGQAAHQTAYNNALMNCRRASRFRACYSDFNRDCNVQRR